MKLFLYPGLGADRELFYPQIEHFGDSLDVQDEVGDAAIWGSKPCLQAAAKWNRSKLIDRLPSDGKYAIGGMSFGGSLAMQIASELARLDDVPQPAAIVLIASNRTSDTISKSFRFQRAVGSRLPKRMIRSLLGMASKLFSNRERLDDPDRHRLRAMAHRADLEKLLWGAAAIADWRFSDADASFGVPIHQIHGHQDWVIPIQPRHATETLEDGRHLITWTHPDRINRWIEASLEAV